MAGGKVSSSRADEGAQEFGGPNERVVGTAGIDTSGKRGIFPSNYVSIHLNAQTCLSLSR